MESWASGRSVMVEDDDVLDLVLLEDLNANKLNDRIV